MCVQLQNLDYLLCGFNKRFLGEGTDGISLNVVFPEYPILYKYLCPFIGGEDSIERRIRSTIMTRHKSILCVLLNIIKQLRSAGVLFAPVAHLLKPFFCIGWCATLWERIYNAQCKKRFFREQIIMAQSAQQNARVFARKKLTFLFIKKMFTKISPQCVMCQVRRD